jgi:hypothetical protein
MEEKAGRAAITQLAESFVNRANYFADRAEAINHFNQR